LQKIYNSLLDSQIRNNQAINKRLIQSLELIVRTRESLAYNPNLKLLLTNLFYKI